MKLMSRLIAAPEETGEKFRSKISSNREAIISTLETILKCHKCALSLKIRAVEILLYPSVDTSPSIMATESSSRIFIWILLLVFLLTDARFEETRGFTHRINTGTNDDIRRLAGDKLSAVLPSQTQDTSTSQLVRVLGDLTEALVDTGSISNSIHAAKILRHLCFHYTRDDEYLKKLKEAIVHVMPKVLKGILGYGWTNEANNDGSESGGVSQCYGQENASCSRQQNCEQGEVGELREALISMCWAIHWRWNKTDPDTSQQLNRVAENICSEQGKPVKHFSDLVNEANEHLETGITRESATTVQIVVT